MQLPTPAAHSLVSEDAEDVTNSSCAIYQKPGALLPNTMPNKGTAASSLQQKSLQKRELGDVRYTCACL